MNEPDVGKNLPFRLRAIYPNQRNIFLSMEGRASGVQVTPPPGYVPPVVECETEVEGQKQKVIFEVRDIDLPLLCHSHENTAQQHLAMLLRAREGDRKAQQLVDRRTEDYFPDEWRETALSTLDESEFIIPSTSRRQYSVNDVSHKGSILLRLSRSGYPVPDFVVFTAKNYSLPPEHRTRHIYRAIQNLEKLSLQEFGATKSPLVFALRCAMPVYIPGVMHTFLNVGVTRHTLEPLADLYGEKPAKRMFLNNLKNLLVMHTPTEHKPLIHKARTDMPLGELDELLDTVIGLAEKLDARFLDDPHHQVEFFIKKAYEHSLQNMDLLMTFMQGAEQCPSLILQKMVCTVRSKRALAGVLHSRHPRTGIGRQLQVAKDVFGEEIMTGMVEPEKVDFNDWEELANDYPAVHHFSSLIHGLEKEYASPITIEFAVDASDRFNSFAMLQLNCSELSGRSAMLSVMDMYEAGTISRQRVIELIRPYHFKQLESDAIDDKQLQTMKPFSEGVSVLPRTAITARAYFSAEAALAAKKNKQNVCLFKERFEPADTVIIREMDAIISGTAAAIHVVTLCQGYGIPALLNLQKHGIIFYDDAPGSIRRLVNSKGEEIKEGNWVTVSSLMSTLFRGKALYRPARLIRYMAGEVVAFFPGEEEWLPRLARAYKAYQELVSHLELSKIAGIRDLIKLVRYEFKKAPEKQEEMVNTWYDCNPALYLDEVFGCEIGAHLNQQTIYLLLSLERQIDFFKKALERCVNEKRSGFSAGSFTLGRFINSPHPIEFWRAFSAAELGLLINEWVLFEKYMNVLREVGERRVLRAKSEIASNKLSPLELKAAKVKNFIQLKLSGTNLAELKETFAPESDPQSVEVVELLQQPYAQFYQFESAWSIGQLKKICQEEGVPLPRPDDI